MLNIPPRLDYLPNPLERDDTHIHRKSSIKFPRCKPHLASPNIKHRHHILQEHISKNIRPVPAIVHPGETAALGIQNQVEGTDEEDLAADLDAELGGLGVAVDDVGAHVVAVDGGRVEERVDGVGLAGGQVEERGAAVDNVLGAVGLEGVGPVAVAVVGVLAFFVDKGLRGDGVEGVLGCDVVGCEGEDLDGRAGEDGNEGYGRETAEGEEAGLIGAAVAAVDGEAEEGRDE